MSDEKEKLKRRVIEFVKAQPGYDEQVHEQLRAFCDDKEGYTVIYGNDEMSGIMGLGETPGLAFKDFERSWEELNGFTWIEKNR